MRLSGLDRLTVGVVLGVPALLVGLLVWVPLLAAIALSFTNWDGIGSVSTNAHWVGGNNYRDLATIYPPFWPAVEHNLYWLAFLFLVPTPFGLFLAYHLEKNIRGRAIYESVFALPVFLSLIVVGLIWELVYSPTQGLINNLFMDPRHGQMIDWLGDPRLNLWAALVAVGWRHAGYVMILYLAGLRSIHPSLREAAATDGAGSWFAFRTVVFPALRRTNVIVVVVTAIEGLRAFDVAWVINGGRNGLELLSVLITDNLISEGPRVGFGSAIAVVLLVVGLIPISLFISRSFRT